jgi:hypothetical protein
MFVFLENERKTVYPVLIFELDLFDDLYYFDCRGFVEYRQELHIRFGDAGKIFLDQLREFR